MHLRRDLGRQRESPSLIGVQDRREHTGRIEVGQAQPIDRPVTGDQRDRSAIADRGDQVGVLMAVIEAAVDPRPGMPACESDGVGERCARDADIDGRMNDLRHRTHRRRPIEDLLVGDSVEIGHRDVVEPGRAAAGGALAEARPIVHQRQARRAALDEDDGRPLALVVGDRDDPVREERAGRIELPAIEDAAAVLVPEDRGPKIERGLRAGLGEGVADS